MIKRDHQYRSDNEPVTGPVPGDWVKVLEALSKDKYLATGVILAILATSLIRKGDHIKVRLPVFILMCFVAVLLILGPDFLRAKNSPDIHASDQYEVLAHYSGVRRTTASTTVPFQVSSGQINFGCGQSLPVTVNFPLPSGATVLSQNVGWANVNNSNATSTSPVAVQGNVVAGAGVIAGLNYQDLLFGVRNCPGGGHGELILSGSYKVDQVSEQQVKEELPPGKLTNVQHPVVFSLPSDPTLQISNISIEFKRTGRAESPARIDMDVSSVSLPMGKRSNDQKFSARLDKDLRLQVDFAQ